jgi:hypothetical protein
MTNQNFPQTWLKIGPINEVMDILYVTKKDKHMNASEKFYRDLETLKDNQVNDTCTVKPNTCSI